MHSEAFTILSLGFILGLKHALDADHLIAVATIVSERKGSFSSSLVGAFWGIGHTLSLLVVGGLVVTLRLQIPERVALALEFAVAVMLVLLGLHVFWKMYKGEVLHIHVHEHHGHKHVHPHMHASAAKHSHPDQAAFHESWSIRVLQQMFRRLSDSKKTIFVGMVHGMAGSAALMLLVLATISSQLLALLYIGIFGIGSIGGMMLMSTLIGLPFAVTAKKSHALNTIVRSIAAATSILFGLFLAWQISFAGGLFVVH
ncbi:MAG: urease accessory protein UreH [Ignavibacteriae bacterium]|nr:urease accessory protein UreH [Ignavibacteriota bacterium]